MAENRFQTIELKEAPKKDENILKDIEKVPKPQDNKVHPIPKTIIIESKEKDQNSKCERIAEEGIKHVFLNIDLSTDLGRLMCNFPIPQNLRETDLGDFRCA